MKFQQQREEKEVILYQKCRRTEQMEDGNEERKDI